ncbi:MAG: alpha/beta fold hydrolase [Myxococcales bacterium]|nr:MAG: alpha/beta fold hydrolase [Myxococcales bacterium]
MNAHLASRCSEPEPTRLRIPEAAWTRLRSHLGQPGVTQQVWDASFAYGVSCDELAELIDYWRDELELPARLLELPCFDAHAAGQHLRFVSARSARPAALPLLLLHGYSGSLFELGALAPALNDAGYDVVSPALPGFGSAEASATAFAEACAELMRGLGYERYAVHGSDLGASLALELAAVDGAHVAALHVSHVPAYPGRDPMEVASLTAEEKSRLARLSELHELLHFHLPESPVEELAFAVSRLDDADLASPRLREDLLTSLTFTCAFGSSSGRAALYRASGLTPASPSSVPTAVEERPLGAPSLRRFAERQRRIVEWREHDSGGPAPGFEDPEGLLQALTRFGERLR